MLAGPMAMPPGSGYPNPHALIHTLVIVGRGLQGLTGIGIASQLVCANFADNLLTDLAGLHACHQLQELTLSNNHLTEVCR